MNKRKDMRRTDWKSILKRDYVAAPCCFQGVEGIASLIQIHEITQPLAVRNGDHDVTIVDKEMSWVQIALRDQYVWVTAMFDKHGRLLQLYFDITDGNRLDPAENPTFEDMYLDIVMEPDGSLYVLDRDEMDEAFEAGKIAQEQYERTIRVGEKLYQWLLENGQTFADFCREQMSRLKGMHENGEA